MTDGSGRPVQPESPIDMQVLLRPGQACIYVGRVITSIIKTNFVPDNQAARLMPNSAANPLPMPQNSADGRSAKTPPKALIYKEFLTLRYLDLDAETWFFPDLREKRTR